MEKRIEMETKGSKLKKRQSTHRHPSLSSQQMSSHTCLLAFIPKKIEFNPDDYQDEAELLFAGCGLSLANRRWLTYLRDDDLRTAEEYHAVPMHVLNDALRGFMSKETVEWAAKMMARPGVVAVSIEYLCGETIRYYSIGYKDGAAFVWAH